MEEFFKGTLIAEIFAKRGNQTEIETEIEEGEEILFDMNDFEKTLHSLIDEKIAKCKHLCDSENQNEKEEIEHSLLHQEIDTLKEILFSSIRKRLEKDCPNIGIRKGFKVVSYETPFEELTRHVGGAIRVIEKIFN